MAAIATLCALALVAPAAEAAPDEKARASIVGGSPADPARWGFTVAILGPNSLCSGSVISPTRVLTAAHCVDDGLPRAVFAGRPDLSSAGVGEVIGVSASSLHPGYAANRTYDIAVLTLERPTLAPQVQLATPADDAAATVPGAIVEIAGFGQRSPFIFNRPRLGVLSETRETVRTGCKRFYRRLFVASVMICSLGRAFRGLVLARSACFGDSGGPMLAETPSGPRLVGVASFVGSLRRGPRRGIKCGYFKLPNVYTRVAAAQPFINVNLGPPAP